MFRGSGNGVLGLRLQGLLLLRAQTVWVTVSGVQGQGLKVGVPKVRKDFN